MGITVDLSAVYTQAQCHDPLITISINYMPFTKEQPKCLEYIDKLNKIIYYVPVSVNSSGKMATNGILTKF